MIFKRIGQIILGTILLAAIPVVVSLLVKVIIVLCKFGYNLI